MAYVYRHIRLDKMTPFYVGKGTNARAWVKKHNPLWRNIVSKHGYYAEIILDGLSEDAAYTKEAEFTRLYKSLGFCEANLGVSDRLGGPVGIIRTPEVCERIRLANLGRKWSGETRRKLKIAYKTRPSSNKGKFGHYAARARKIICVETGIVYGCQIEAAKDLGLTQQHISKVCLGKRKSHGGLTFKFYDKVG